MRLIQLPHPRERRQPGQRDIQGVEAHIHRGAFSFFFSSTCSPTFAAPSEIKPESESIRKVWMFQGEFSSLHMLVNGSLTIRNVDLFELSSNDRSRIVSETDLVPLNL